MIWDNPTPPPRKIEPGSKEWLEKVDKLMDSIHHDIEEGVGWSAVHVFSEKGSTAFTYTIGLMENFDHPDLIIYGVDDEIAAHGMLDCAIELIKDGTRFEDGKRYANIMQDPYLMEAKDHPPGPPLNWASKYYGEPAEAIQLVWPDREGVFPDEEGFEEEYKGQQDQREEA